MGFNKVNVDLFFKNLCEVLDGLKFTPDRIFNMVESGISTVPNHVPKVICSKGKKSVGKVSSAERGQLATVICAMSASGHFIPPAIIFKRKREKAELMNGAPPNSLLLVSESGYTNAQLFVKWLRHFQHHAKATKEAPILLIIDNHSSHLTLESVMFCRQNYIHVLTIPPHSSHKLQPLDRCFFKTLKTYFAEASNNWLVSNPGRVITQFQMSELFGVAYLKSASVGKAVNSFKSCGIFPMNPSVFTEEDFLPSSVTNMVQSQNEFDLAQPTFTNSLTSTPPSIANAETVNTGLPENVSNPGPNFVNTVVTPVTDLSVKKSAMTPTSDKNSSKVGLISPLPKRKTEQRRNGKGQKSCILTNSPYKII